MALSAAQFLADVALVRQALGDGAHVLNVCADRYRFTVGLAAGLAGRQGEPACPRRTPREVIRQLRAFAPDAVCLTDERDCDIELPQRALPRRGQRQPAAIPFAVPQIESTRLVAYVFTSGSTGTPLPYRKTWGPLVACVREEARRLGLRGPAPWSIVATVPPQHQYGFESSVLMALARCSCPVRRAAVLPGRHRRVPGRAAAPAGPHLDPRAPARPDQHRHRAAGRWTSSSRRPPP